MLKWVTATCPSPWQIIQSKEETYSWTSPSRDFAFRFQQIGKDGFLLAIWFNKTPQRTVVWPAKGNNIAQEGSKVEVAESGLLLYDPTGEQIWKASTAGTRGAYAAMLDSGNFVLADNNSVTLWESFDDATDMLLPTQTLTQERKLVARYSEANYSSGRFHLIVQQDGNLVLYTTMLPLDAANTGYLNSDTAGNGFRLSLNQSGFLYVEAKNGTVLNILSVNDSSTEDFYHRATLEYDDSSSRGWNMEWYSSTSIPSDICTAITEDKGSGACGYNNYCSLGGLDRRPICHCPKATRILTMKGCRQDYEAQICHEDSLDSNSFYFDTMSSTNFPYSDYEYRHLVNEDLCRNSCLAECFCDGVYFRDNNCWKGQVPLRNGRINTEAGGKTLIKLRKGNSTTKIGGRAVKKKDYTPVVFIGTMLLSSSVFLNLLLVATFLVLFHFNRKAKVSQAQPTRFMPDMNLQSFTYAELDKATNEFKVKLGRGAFGTFFKGVVALNNRSIVAVKKLDNMVREGEQEFKAELIGFCNEGQHRLLVYEFISNSSLASFLFGPSRPNWHQRRPIALGTARALLYLHEECSTHIIHYDIKPQNIFWMTASQQKFLIL
ncbi:Tyrosine-protein kinase, partial [Parasponia andersonii]